MPSRKSDANAAIIWLTGDGTLESDPYSDKRISSIRIRYLTFVLVIVIVIDPRLRARLRARARAAADFDGDTFRKVSPKPFCVAVSRIPSPIYGVIFLAHNGLHTDWPIGSTAMPWAI